MGSRSQLLYRPAGQRRDVPSKQGRLGGLRRVTDPVPCTFRAPLPSSLGDMLNQPRREPTRRSSVDVEWARSGLHLVLTGTSGVGGGFGETERGGAPRRCLAQQ